MGQAIDVARFFLKLAAGEPEPEYLSHMRLQKLLYYAQAWSLTLRGKPLFTSAIEAWVHGPVVRAVYPQFADYGDSPIPFHEASAADGLNDDDKALIESVWRGYRRFSATQLRRMTHRERPWLEARTGCGSDESSQAEIPHEAIRRYFTQVYERKNPFQGLALKSIRAAGEQFRSGARGMRLDDALKKLKNAV